MNGYGERCGNCNLIPLVCNLELKLGHTTVGRENIGKMTSFANYIADMANLVLTNGAAFVGKSAFAHKGGIHVSAVLREASTYEHVEPETVGNERRVLVSDLSGRSNIAFKLQEKGWEEKLDDAARKRVLARIKQMEFEGYELESADGSFELLIRQALAPETYFFKLDRMRMVTHKSGWERSQCAVKMTVDTPAGPQQAEVSASGPFDAIAGALRRCLGQVYPAVADIRLWTTRCACSIRARAPRPRCGC